MAARHEKLGAHRDHDWVVLDGARGEGGGQILRTALSLALITGRPFRILRIRARRDKPGLRPQHLLAVRAAAELCNAEVQGDAVGSQALTFRPGPVRPRDLHFEIGTAGATGLVLQTLALPLALSADRPVRLTLIGGTFNTRAPSYPFLEATWRAHLARMGLKIALAMPVAGFYPIGGGRLEAWIEPGHPHALTLLDRGPFRRIYGTAGTARLPEERRIGPRLRDKAVELLASNGLPDAEIEVVQWQGPGQGAAIALTAEFEHAAATFVGLGERGKPAEVVAAEAVLELLEYHGAAGAVDAHSADQILLPLALAEGTSTYTVAEPTEHLRTNITTIGAFLDRDIRLEDPRGTRPARVVIT